MSARDKIEAAKRKVGGIEVRLGAGETHNEALTKQAYQLLKDALALQAKEREAGDAMAGTGKAYFESLGPCKVTTDIGQMVTIKNTQKAFFEALAQWEAGK